MATLYTKPRHDPHGLNPQEEAIMDLWDDGLSMDDIAARLAMPFSYVRATVSTMSEGRSDRWHLHARAATERLGMALAKAMAA
jgi:DNA-binding NarL/FixJ family response regulator